MKHHTRSTMRKEGPCGHCGVKETPLWRNGPPEKPVLCNACGSRWRIRGNLNDYVPNKRGTAVRRTKKRSRRVYYNPFKWVDNKDEEEEEDSNNEDESDKESTRCKKTRHCGSGSESITTVTSEEPGKLYDVVVQSGIIISDDEDEKDGSGDDSHVVVEEMKVQDNYAELAWTPSNDDDEDEDWPLEHIKKLQMELYEMFKNEKSSSSSSSQCSSLSESLIEDEEVLLYNLSNPHFCENEVGLGSVLLKPEHKCNGAT